jgi:hypothetical protein
MHFARVSVRGWSALLLASMLVSCGGGSSTIPPDPATVALTAALQTDVDNFLAARAAITHISTVALDLDLRDRPRTT